MSNNISNIAIKVEGLGKKYLIKHEQKESYQTFQDLLLNGSKNLVSSLNPFKKLLLKRGVILCVHLKN